MIDSFYVTNPVSSLLIRSGTNGFTVKNVYGISMGQLSEMQSKLTEFQYIGGMGTLNRFWYSGPRLNIKTVLSTYGDFHVKDKTAVRTSYL